MRLSTSAANAAFFPGGHLSAFARTIVAVGTEKCLASADWDHFQGSDVLSWTASASWSEVRVGREEEDVEEGEERGPNDEGEFRAASVVDWWRIKTPLEVDSWTAVHVGWEFAEVWAANRLRAGVAKERIIAKIDNKQGGGELAG